MPQWGTFAWVTIVVLLLLLALTRLTQRAVSPDADGQSTGGPGSRAGASRSRTDDSTAGPRSAETDDERADGETDEKADGETDDRTSGKIVDRTWEVPADRGPDPDGGPANETPTARDADAADRRSSDVGGPEAVDRSASGPHPVAESGTAAEGEVERARESPADRDARPGAEIDPSELSTGALLANVALSQGLFGAVLIGAAIYAGIPAEALGIELSRSYLVSGLLLGTAAGVGLYVANELGAAGATRFGFDHDEDLRELLAPDAFAGWVVLLVGVLPVIAAFEELLFRAALIGALSAGFGLSPWLLAALSSIAFGLGHGMQGTVGVVVTAVLGFALAAAFVLTGSLLVVIVAHYLINAFEFVVHEGVGFDWATVLER